MVSQVFSTLVKYLNFIKNLHSNIYYIIRYYCIGYNKIGKNIRINYDLPQAGVLETIDPRGQHFIQDTGVNKSLLAPRIRSVLQILEVNTLSNIFLIFAEKSNSFM